MTNTAGQRFVQLSNDFRILVHDFNPYHVRQCVGQMPVPVPVPVDAGGSVQVIREKHVMSGVKMFGQGRKSPWAKDVRSELPYVLTVSGETFRYVDALVDEERVIAAKVCFSGFLARCLNVIMLILFRYRECMIILSSG
jgi:hypothetical protein